MRKLILSVVILVLLITSCKSSKTVQLLSSVQKFSLAYVTDYLFSLENGQRLLSDMDNAGISVLVDGTVYGTGSNIVEITAVPLEDVYGLYYHDPSFIQINSRWFGIRNTDEVAATMAHEIQHAIDYATGNVCNTEFRAQMRAANILYGNELDYVEICNIVVGSR